MPLVAVLGLVRLWITIPSFGYVGAWSCGLDGINDRALAHGHALSAEVILDLLKNQLAQVILFQ